MSTGSLKLNYWLIGLLVVIGVHLFLLTRLIFFPYPELFIYSYLTDQGLLPYKQIMDQHFPGLMFFPINLYSLGMITPEVARYWHLGIVTLTHILLFLVAYKLFKSKKLALFSSIFYLIWQPFYEGYVLWIDSFVPLFLLSAFYLLIDWTKNNKLPRVKNRQHSRPFIFAKAMADRSGSTSLTLRVRFIRGLRVLGFRECSNKSSYLFWAGLFLGIGLIFKQTTAPLIVLIAVFAWLYAGNIKRITPFVLGIGIPVAVMFFFILSIDVWEDFFYWTVVFNLTTFSQMGRKYPDLAGIIKISPVFLLAAFLLIPQLIRNGKRTLMVRKKFSSLVWLGSFFLGSLVFAYARFDFIHLQPALPFAILIVVDWFRKLDKKLASFAFLVYATASFYLIAPFYKISLQKRVFFYGEFERKIAGKVLEHANEGETIFAYGVLPHLYQMTKTLPPGKVFVFQFPWFMVEAENKILSGIISDHPKVIIKDKTATTAGANLISYMPKIDKYISDNYKVVDNIENIEILVEK